MNGWQAVLILPLAVGLASCIDDKGTAVAPGQAVVRTVNASPDAGAVSVAIDNATVASVGFLVDSAVSVPSGVHTYTVNAAGGSSPLASSPVFVSPTITYDFIFAGVTGGASPNQTLIGGQNGPPGVDLSKYAALRLYNAVAETGSFGNGIDVAFTDSTGSFANTKYALPGLSLFSSAVNDANGNGAYFAIVPGTYHVKVTAAGDTVRTSVAADSMWTFNAGQVRTIVATPSADQASGNLVLITDN